MALPTPQPVPPAPLRVVVADGDPLARRLVRDTLQAAGITVIAEAASGREAVELATYYRPDVLLLDHRLRDLDGLEAIRRIAAVAPGVRVVILTGEDDPELGLAALRAGAAGYLSKNIELEALPRALRGALGGEAVISRQLAMLVIQRLRSAPSSASGLRPVRSPLTAREWEVLDLLSSGLGTDQIAHRLVLSSETVRSHLKNLYRKLGVRSREDAVAAARRLREPRVA